MAKKTGRFWNLTIFAFEAFGLPIKLRFWCWSRLPKSNEERRFSTTLLTYSLIKRRVSSILSSSWKDGCASGSGLSPLFEKMLFLDMFSGEITALWCEVKWVIFDFLFMLFILLERTLLCFTEIGCSGNSTFFSFPGLS